MKSRVLLVHGAWFGPECWSEVIEGLTERGIDAFASDLHRGSVLADIAAVEADIERLAGDGKVVVCAHSYGGRVISGVDPARVGHLVYLAASMPEPHEEASSSPPTPELREAMVMNDDGTCVVQTDAARSLLFHDCPPSAADRALSQLRPQVAAVFGQDIPQACWKVVPSTYVVCAEDRAISPKAQTLLATRATKTVTWQSGHCPFLSRLKDVVGLLSNVVAGLQIRSDA